MIIKAQLCLALGPSLQEQCVHFVFFFLFKITDFSSVIFVLIFSPFPPALWWRRHSTHFDYAWDSGLACCARPATRFASLSSHTIPIVIVWSKSDTWTHCVAGHTLSQVHGTLSEQICSINFIICPANAL